MNVDIRIEPEPGPWPGEQYRLAWPVGGEISGRVIVFAEQDLSARNVRLELAWETSGRGSTDKAKADVAMLHNGDVPGGQTLDLPFNVAIPPDGPITYEGHYIHIHWRLRAVVDIPWARDKTAEFNILVLPDYDRA